MAFKSLFKKVKSFSGYDDFIKNKTKQFVTKNHLSTFQKLVAPLETQIPFHVVEREVNGNLQYIVEPIPGILFTRTSSSQSTATTEDLYKWLNEGTNVRHADMPKEFSNETTPNSLNTVHQQYNRAKIYVSRAIQNPGLEPRNWNELVLALHEKGYSETTKGTILEFIKSRFKS